ncbi:MAG: tetratricopeptide repeat protein [Oligoflexia bacterium]|nr:tetratricopeptide repeat protein [Oligoflexia bacterium]
MSLGSEIFSNIYVLSKWWKTWKTLPVLPWVRAASLYRAGKFDRAEAFYRKGIKRAPNHPAQFCARLDLAYCLFKSGKIEDAEKELRFVVTRLKKGREAPLRLARLQLWSGRSLEAAWTLRKALNEEPADLDILSTFMLAVLEHGGPSYLWNEALNGWRALNEQQKQTPRMRALRARFALVMGEVGEYRNDLEKTALNTDAPFEALLLFSETLLEEGKVAHARMELRRVLALEPNHPRTLSMLAEVYLRSGPFYNPEFAQQLASSACQSSGWLSAREMHILAEAYYHSGDNVSALNIANKARQCGSRLLGEYRHMMSLERLIEALNAAPAGPAKVKVL